MASDNQAITEQLAFLSEQINRQQELIQLLARDITNLRAQLQKRLNENDEHNYQFASTARPFMPEKTDDSNGG